MSLRLLPPDISRASGNLLVVANVQCKLYNPIHTSSRQCTDTIHHSSRQCTDRILITLRSRVHPCPSPPPFRDIAHDNYWPIFRLASFPHIIEQTLLRNTHKQTQQTNNQAQQTNKPRNKCPHPQMIVLSKYTLAHE